MKDIADKEKELGARRAKRDRKAEHEIAAGEKKELNLRMARWYFFVGCFGLPLVHFVSVLYFSRELKGHSGDFQIKRYIYLSLIVAIIETFIWILWVVLFYLLNDTTLSNFSILNANPTLNKFV